MFLYCSVNWLLCWMFPKAMRDFENLLMELEQEGSIFKTHKNRYGVPERMNLIVGYLQGNERGYGFVIPDDANIRDIFISSENLNGAMHKDRVIARINKKVIGDKRAEGEIIRIIKRANDTVVGTFENSRYFGFVVPMTLGFPEIFLFRRMKQRVQSQVRRL